MQSSTDWNEFIVNVKQPSVLFVVYLAANGITDINVKCVYDFLFKHTFLCGGDELNDMGQIGFVFS